MNPKRKILMEYASASRNIELAHAATLLLECMNAPEASKAIAILQRCQQKQLVKLDAAAKKLGAPYPGKGATP